MKYIIGIICILLGFTLRLWSMRDLGKDFQEIIQVPSKVVKTGIYKYFKHPAYWGSMMIIGGASLISIYLGIMLTAFVFYRSRMVLENEIIKRCNHG